MREKTIVIVEDEFRTRTGLANLINKLEMGARVIGEASDGVEGLRMIQDLEPDFVFADIRMPRSDGLDMIAKAKQMGFSCTFVIISGYAEFEYAQKAIRLGVGEYLLKPATIADVKALLAKLIPAKEEQEGPDELANYSPVVRKIVEFVRENYGRRIGLESVAEEFHLTPQYISNLFTKETGTTFSNYLRQVRMERAKELLLHTDMKIYEVACAVGYPDQKYFSKVFKEYTNVSAKQFALHREEE